MKNLKSFNRQHVNNTKYWLVSVLLFLSTIVLQVVNGDETDAASSTTIEPRKSLDSCTYKWGCFRELK